VICLEGVRKDRELFGSVGVDLLPLDATTKFFSMDSGLTFDELRSRIIHNDRATDLAGQEFYRALKGLIDVLEKQGKTPDETLERLSAIFPFPEPSNYEPELHEGHDA
jgi:hypothetical protein